MDTPTTRHGTATPHRDIPGPFDLLWRWLNSLPIAIVVMLLLAILSAIGTMIPQSHLAEPPQGMSFPDFLAQRYGAPRAHLITFLGWDHIYFTWYFFALMLWLSVSAVICNITRYRRTVRQWQAPPINRDSVFFTANPRGVAVDSPPSGALDELAATLAQLHYRVMRGEYRGGQVLYADRGYIKKWALVLLHVAILVLLAGGMIGATFGSKGTIALGDGEDKPLVIPRDEHKHPLVKPWLAKLPPLVYDLHQGHFRIDYDKKIFVPTDVQQNVPDALKPYYGYFVKEFVSTLAVDKDGHTVGPQEVKVNHPLHIERLVVYQSGYQQQGYLRVDYGGGNVQEFPAIPETWLALSPQGVMMNEVAQQMGTGVANLAFNLEQVKAGDLYEGGKKVGHIGPLTIAHLGDRVSGQDSGGVLIDTAHGFTAMLNGKPVDIRMSPRVDNTSIFSYARDPGLVTLTLGWILLVIGIAGAMYIPFTQVQARVEAGRAYVLIQGSGSGTGDALPLRLHAILSGAP